jgi:hypothetical protein
MRLMTTGTGNINMLAVENKCGLFVSEPRSFPVFGTMTFAAVRHTVFFELLKMNILMAS